jgi:hypothetical protein
MSLPPCFSLSQLPRKSRPSQLQRNQQLLQPLRRRKPQLQRNQLRRQRLCKVLLAPSAAHQQLTIPHIREEKTFPLLM